jgi:hypothetical protein
MNASLVSKVKAVLRLSHEIARDERRPLKAAPYEVGDILVSPMADNSRQVDAQTWKDLDLDELTQRVSKALVLTGQPFSPSVSPSSCMGPCS